MTKTKGSAGPKTRKTKTKTTSWKATAKTRNYTYAAAVEHKDRNEMLVMIDTGSSRVHRICQQPWIPEFLPTLIREREEHGHLLGMSPWNAEIFVNGGLAGDGLEFPLLIIDALAALPEHVPLLFVTDSWVRIIEVQPTGEFGRVLVEWKWPPDNLNLNASGGAS